VERQGITAATFAPGTVFSVKLNPLDQEGAFVNRLRPLPIAVAAAAIARAFAV
jgi:hypothetical protein